MEEQSEAIVDEQETTEEDTRSTRQPVSARRRPRRSFRRPRKPRQCAFCVSKVSEVDYKQVDLLEPYVKEGGKIRPRRQTGLCAKHQRRVARAIKRARHLALLPFTTARRGRFSS